MKKNSIKNIFIAILILISSSLLGQESYYWQLTDEEELPSNTVYMTLQDSRGLMWIATANGLCYYDGKTIHKIQNTALKDNEILKIQEGIDGNIWGINLAGQLFKCDTKQLIVVSKLADYALSYIKNFEWVGTLLFVTEFSSNWRGDLSISYDTFNNLAFTHPPYYLNLAPSYISISKLSNTEILYSHFNGRDILISKKNLSNRNQTIFTILNTKKRFSKVFSWNNYLFVCFTTDIFYLNLNSSKILKHFISETLISYHKNEQYLFLTFEKHIYIFDKNLNQVYTIKNNKYNHVFKDNENNIWISTKEYGVLIFPNLNIFIDKKIPATYAIKKLDTQNTILCTDDGFIYKIDQNGQIKQKYLISQGKVNDIIYFNQQYYVASNNALNIYDTNFNLLKIAERGAFKNLLLSSDNYLFCAGSQYFRLQLPKVFNIKYFRSYALIQDKNGTIWIGTPSGLYKYQTKNNAFLSPDWPNNNERFVEQQYSDVFTETQPNISALTMDSLGRIWAVSHGHGVIIINNEKIESILDEHNAFQTNTFNCVYTEGRYVWLGSDRGVYRYDIFTKKIININKYDGLPTNEILSLCSLNDKLLVGTSKGLSMLPIDNIEENTTLPNINLLDIKINEVSQGKHKKLFELDYHQNNIEIDFISYQYKARGDARYEYRIMELDTQWTMTTERSLRFTNLRSGNYHIQLRAVNEDDIRSSENIQLNFDIKKPFWLQWWFYLTLAGVIASGTFWFLRRKYRRELRFEDLKMQALQAQMNPHFIFNALNAIQHFLTTNDEKNATKYLSQFARLIRTVFEYNKKKEISLSEEIDMLSLYLSLEKLRFNQKIAVHLNISEEVNQLQHNIFFPPLLIQPIIENSFKHGLFHKKNNGNLWIDFQLLPNERLKCIIKDDGVGREYVKHLPNWKGVYSSSGVLATQQRLDFWHKQLQTGINNYFSIEDLYIDNIPAGTCVTLIL